ncbi:AAA family ATPase [Bifidobacterium moukalabense]|uniref:AAA family ATPase n=2 Tax=Bifidobacterium moukalabense TaxID=1333651 RepID=UPI001FCEF1E0|nr:P-loop NTPase [Bifidobacterium moukalabense]
MNTAIPVPTEVPLPPQASPLRRPVSPQCFYTPPGAVGDGCDGTIPIRFEADPSPQGSACGTAARSNATRPMTANADMGSVVMLSSAVAGVGVSTLAAMLARTLAQRGVKCVLVDADLQGGGLDVLLGIENEDGSRFGDINAPLGKVDGKALLRELPVWDGVPVLSCDPWKVENPQWWEIQACIRSLAQTRRMVIVDAASHIGLDGLEDCIGARHIVVVEMTVLGLARAKALLKSSGTFDGDDGPSPILVGIGPRGTIRNRGTTDVAEAEEYLGREIDIVIRPDGRLCSALLEGLGLRKPNTATRKALERLADCVRGKVRKA